MNTAASSLGLMPGQRLGSPTGQPLILEKLIQQGGFSQIWRARLYDARDLIAAPVVLKAPQWRCQDSLGMATSSADPDSRAATIEAIRQEAAALTILDHLPVPQLHSVIEHEGVPTLAIEYVPGVNLKTILVHAKTLPAQIVIRIGFKIAEALCHIHRYGVYHCDIKPDNIMAAPHYAAVTLIDFGLSRTRTGGLQNKPMFMGTAAYAPPELFGLHDQVSPQTDIFSIGATMFAARMGIGPYLAQDMDEIAANAKAGRISRPAETIPRGLGQLIGSCLEFNPANRPTAVELASQLLTMQSPRRQPA